MDAQMPSILQILKSFLHWLGFPVSNREELSELVAKPYPYYILGQIISSQHLAINDTPHPGPSPQV